MVYDIPPQSVGARRTYSTPASISGILPPRNDDANRCFGVWEITRNSAEAVSAFRVTFCFEFVPPPPPPPPLALQYGNQGSVRLPLSDIITSGVTSTVVVCCCPPPPPPPITPLSPSQKRVCGGESIYFYIWPDLRQVH